MVDSFGLVSGFNVVILRKVNTENGLYNTQRVEMSKMCTMEEKVDRKNTDQQKSP